MEELNTESKQTSDNNISMDVIYRTLPKLEPEFQHLIAINYKLTDLHYWINHYDKFEKFLKELLSNANLCTKIVNALIQLYNGALLENRNKISRSVEDMGRIYDALTEESKKKACEELLGKKKFFEDACLRIMDSFNQAVEVKGDDSGSGIPNDVVNAKMEK